MLRAVDDIADAVPRKTKSLKNVSGQLSMFDTVPKYELAGVSRGKSFSQPSLAQFYDTLQQTPNSALQADEYLDYVNSLSNRQIQDLLPQSSSDIIEAQTRQETLRRMQEMSQNPDTRPLAEFFRKIVK